MLISAKDIILQTIQLYRQNAALFLRYMTILFIPLGISIIVGAFFSLGEPTSLLLGVLSITIMLCVYLTSLLVTLAFIRVVATRYAGKQTKPILEELRAATPLLWPAIIGSILAGLAIIGGLFLLVVPGIIFSVWFAFVVYAIAIDGYGATEAMRSSKALVAGKWMGVLWRLLAPGVVFGIVILAFEGLFSLVAGNIAEGISSEQTALYIGTTIIFGLVSSIVSLLLTPLTTAAPIILYQELKKSPAVKK
ncbi:MAG: hypothetical protein COU33_01725 [Candidatus Magasanikbacteria bacterium CG10_big_fil_rev_8_21_14_0_10_43_6]|uniref:DUF7847 domain-containing protein n=1 Tax=Candidatus Magasanikbacteria bacterium CG10_big_fil_rev_8_21_14_0_10_43_6 TaxID=1974650 RepID=A0A2M6W1M8_9BACT|nr:MAG: hypothetical protein COU33_01725 [Candidatus Magasanikbacteria bacterium CG10_big_fil_rev_8_21_14_0_10_43_6]